MLSSGCFTQGRGLPVSLAFFLDSMAFSLLENNPRLKESSLVVFRIRLAGVPCCCYCSAVGILVVGFAAAMSRGSRQSPLPRVVGLWEPTAWW